MKVIVSTNVEGSDMTYTLDVVPFIKEVKNHPELWDSSDNAKKFKKSKQQAWFDISRVFIPEIEEMSEEDQFNVLKKLYNKWRNIRDAYVRYMKKPEGRPYIYAKQLTFLNKFYRFGKYSEKSEKSDSSEADDDNRVTLCEENWQSDGDETHSSPKRRKIKIENDVREISIDYVDPSLDKEMDVTNAYSFEDDDRSFFDSLLPAVRTFNMDQKLHFRSEVLSLIRKTRKS